MLLLRETRATKDITDGNLRTAISERKQQQQQKQTEKTKTKAKKQTNKQKKMKHKYFNSHLLLMSLPFYHTKPSL